MDKLAGAYADRAISLRVWLAARGPIDARPTAASHALIPAHCRTSYLDS
jgi:hypothetical protein